MVIVILKKYHSFGLVSKNISASQYGLLRPKFIGSGSNIKPNDSGYRCPTRPRSDGPSYSRTH